MSKVNDTAFFERVREHVNGNPGFRRLGTADMSVVFAIGENRCRVVFEAFEIASVAAVTAEADRDADLVIALEEAPWRDYLRARREGQGQSLLSLDLDIPGGLVKARNPLSRLAFERYIRSLQAFVDAGAALAA